MLNILPTPTFYQLETPQLNLKLPTTQQVNGKYPTTKSTLDQLTTAHHLSPVIWQFLKWGICWEHVEMGGMLRNCWGWENVEKRLIFPIFIESVICSRPGWVRCWEYVERTLRWEEFWEDIDITYVLQKLMQRNAETTSSLVPSYFLFRLLILVFVGCCGTRSGWVGWSGRSRCSSTPRRSSSTSSPWQGRKCNLRNNYFD